MPTETKVSKFILQLTKATVDKEIKWERIEAPATIGFATNDVISTYVQTEYKGQRLALFERRYRAYDGEHDVSYWTGDDVLVILNRKHEIIWEHRENSSALSNLYRVAKESASDVDNLLDSLLD